LAAGLLLGVRVATCAAIARGHKLSTASFQISRI
jgi:hypothetical protein